MRKKQASELRSSRWFGQDTLRGFGHHSRIFQMGYAKEDFEGKPVIAILNSWSDLSPCHAHFPERVKEVKRGILQAGGFPLEFPALSLSENFMKPTTMLYRNFLAMEVEEILRAHPIDGAVLMGGCDKTVPGLLMGAISVDIPAIFMPAGPMLRGHSKGKTLGSGADVWKSWADKQAGLVSDEEWEQMSYGIARSYGTCMTMGTAATMMSIADTMGFTLPGASSIVAADSSHGRMAAATGRMAVDMVWRDAVPSSFIQKESIKNAMIVHQAMAGSTNAIIHLIAISRRAGIDLTLQDFDDPAETVPVLANIRPAGEYLMEDFYYAGGLKALQKNLSSFLDLSTTCVTGEKLCDVVASAECYMPDVVRSLEDPVAESGGTAVLFGNLAPDGAVMKPASADPKLLKHSGPAIVFDSYDEMEAAMDDDDLEVTADSVLVLRNAGPLGGPGMPEWGMLPIPKKLLKQGVRDMLRISDARMSGTSYGACVLHVAPESRAGGPLAALRTGDIISVDVEARYLNVNLSEEDFARRFGELEDSGQGVAPAISRGYLRLALDHIQQAPDGCDFDFLEGTDKLPEPEIH